jgi:hypothetical protein
MEFNIGDRVVTRDVPETPMVIVKIERVFGLGVGPAERHAIVEYVEDAEPKRQYYCAFKDLLHARYVKTRTGFLTLINGGRSENGSSGREFNTKPNGQEANNC